MCGLCGFSGDNPDYNAIKIMLIDNEVRGSHSTGIATLRHIKFKPDRTTVRKSSERASLFVINDEVNRALKGANEIICHTRYATMGKHSEENAHPYRFSGNDLYSVTGTHNGWLLDEDRIRVDELKGHGLNSHYKKYEMEEFEVDSMAIFHHIFQTQNPESISDFEGAMALAFIYRGNLYLYRRESKPLYILSKKEGIYYSSRRESFTKAFGNREGKRARMIDENCMLVYRNGRLRESIAIAPPKVKVYMDENPYAFYTRVNPTYNISRTGTNTHYGYQNLGYAYEDYEDYGHYGRQLPISTTESQYEANKVFNSNKESSVSLYEQLREVMPTNVTPSSMLNVFNIPLSSKDFLECMGYKFKDVHYKAVIQERSLSKDQAVVLMTLLDSVSKEPLKGFRVAIDGYDGASSISNEKGYVAINLPSTFIGDKCRLLIHPPHNYHVDIEGAKFYPTEVYEHKIKVENRQVVEVTCEIPFLLQPNERVEKSRFKALQDILPEGTKINSVSGDVSTDSRDSDIQVTERNWSFRGKGGNSDSKKADSSVPISIEDKLREIRLSSDHVDLEKLLDFLDDILDIYQIAYDAIGKDKDLLIPAWKATIKFIEGIHEDKLLEPFSAELIKIRDQAVMSFAKDCKTIEDILSTKSRIMMAFCEDLEALGPLVQNLVTDIESRMTDLSSVDDHEDEEEETEESVLYD